MLSVNIDANRSGRVCERPKFNEIIVRKKRNRVCIFLVFPALGFSVNNSKYVARSNSALAFMVLKANAEFDLATYLLLLTLKPKAGKTKNMHTRFLFFLTIISLNFGLSQTRPLRFASIFTDSMVLQQKSEVAVWGKGSAGKKITIQSSWKNGASAMADSEGTWSTTLKTTKAGGPYQIQVTDGDTTITLN